MKDKKKIEKGSITETSLELAPFAVQLLDPEVVSNPMAVAVKVGIGIVSHFTAKLFSEFKDKIKNGTLKNKDFSTEKPALIFTDLCKVIDDGKIDEERFKAMKSIFFYSVSKEATEKTEKDAYEMMQITKELSSMEVLILRANFNMVIGTAKSHTGKNANKRTNARGAWFITIANELGYDFPEIVGRHEKHLMELKLISEIDNPARNAMIPTDYFRLTTLGYKLCEFITKYD